jgi:hypothetical protein
MFKKLGKIEGNIENFRQLKHFSQRVLIEITL